METKITLQKNKITQNAIKVDEVTYRYNWANEKILEDEREEKTFNSLEELKSYVSTFTPLNQRLYREAKKKKTSILFNETTREQITIIYQQFKTLQSWLEKKKLK